MAYKDVKPNPPGVMKRNNDLMMKMDKDRVARQSSHEKALSKAKGGHKQGEREVRSKKAGFYVQGHKNYGDVYEA